MEKIFTLFFIFTLSVSGVFAQEEIDVAVSNTHISLGENFTYSITINTPEREIQDVSFEIPGLDNFQIFSQGQSYNYRNINGQTQGSIQYTLDLQTISEGEFSLGPIKILTGSGELIDDETITVFVSKGNSLKSLENNNKQEDEGDEILQKSENLGNIKPYRYTGIPWVLILSFIVFLGTFYYILVLIFKSKKAEKNNSVKIPEQENISKNEKIIQYFSNLGKENDSISSQEFFKKYNAGMREVFSELGIKNAHKITLSELSAIENIKENNIFSLFKKSYKYEYAGVEISAETRNKYIIDIIGILQK